MKWKGGNDPIKSLNADPLAQYIFYNSKLLVHVACFTGLVKTRLWAVLAEQPTCAVHSISAQTSQEGIEYAKTKE